MKPLVVLLLVFIISLFTIRIVTGHYETEFAGRIAMSAMLAFTSIAHFVFTKGMEMMMPKKIPFKRELVFGTGIIELLAAVGLLIPSLTTVTAWLLIVFFIVLLPANINAAMNRVDYQKGTSDGNGPRYLWFRIPLQLLFIVWVYLSAIR